jgi:sulfatase maturation enzyme AslB (radical SAM superfamily)
VAAEPWALESLFLVLTSACNLRCTYCYNSRGAPARMEWPTVEAAVARLWASQARDARLLVTGGEPLLEFALLQRLVEHVRATKPPGRTVSFDLLTNGTRLREEQIAFLARHRVSVQISLDGIEPAQRLRGSWTIPRLGALVSYVRDRHRTWFQRRVSAAMILVPETVPYLADSVEDLMRRGFTEITVGPAMGDIPGWHDGLLPLLDEQYARVYGFALRHYRRTGQVPLTVFRKDSSSGEPPSTALCRVESGHMAAVDVDGQVYGCPCVVGSALERPLGLLRAASDAMRIGSICDPNLPGRLPAYRDALASTGLFDRRDGNYSSYGACRDCAHVRHCGVCPLSIALAPGASDPRKVPDFICAYNRVSRKYRRRFPLQRDD